MLQLSRKKVDYLQSPLTFVAIPLLLSFLESLK